MKDPIIDELHRCREEYARQFNYDLDAICKDLQAVQQERGLKVVRLPPDRLKAKQRTSREHT
ncbi:MAG TPA: hypothetical protein PKH24_15495 [Sedimentisphaerales bacterium]|jgi:hypothetical protein|nr:hypothetical protein [Sedimentisphaerales bacterium]HNU30446.1 hypothetical protein [Sedimentisphaerales bacterium]